MENITGNKILFVITKSNLGGAQKYVYELACAAKNAGGIVSVALGGSGRKNAPIGPLAENLSVQNIPSHTITNFMRDMSIKNDLLALKELLTLIRSERPDVLHVTSSKAGGLGALAGRLSGVPTIIFTSHGLTYNETWRPLHQRLAIKMMTWVTLLLAHQSIMISKGTYRQASKFPFVKNKIKLIYNGVQPQLLVPRNDARHILSPDMPTKGAIWIGGIGELHANKNWMLLIEAMPSLPKNVYCIIIGEGDQRGKLEKRIKELGLEDRVLLTGYIHGAPLLPAYDIFILPSKKEGLPYVLLEAGMAKSCVVCSAISGNTDIITHEKNGLFVEQTVRSLVYTIEKLTQNKERRKELGLALHQTVTTRFSMEKMTEQTFELYR